MAYYGSFGNFASGGQQQYGSAPFYGQSAQFGQPQLGFGSRFGAPSGQQFGSAPFYSQPQPQFGQPQQFGGFGQGFNNSSFGAPVQQFGATPFYGQTSTQFGQPQQLGFNALGARAGQQFGASPYYSQPQFGQPQQFGGFGQGFNNSYGFVGQQSGATVTADAFNAMPENTQKNSLDLSQYVRSTAAPPTGNDESPVSAALDSLKGDIEAARKAAENSPKV